jgi:hypothetical protein
MKRRLLQITGPALTFLALAKPAFAGDLTSLTITPPEGTGVSNIGTLINAVFIAAVVIAILFVFAMLLMGGYGWITAGGDKAKVEEARTRITNALIGLAIVASAFAIAALVANFFGVDFTNLELPDATS